MAGIEVATGELTPPQAKMVNGLIPKGFVCPYSNKCKGKEKACNSFGCPVGNGKIHTVDFSCGLARGFRICDRNHKK